MSQWSGSGSLRNYWIINLNEKIINLNCYWNNYFYVRESGGGNLSWKKKVVENPLSNFKVIKRNEWKSRNLNDMQIAANQIIIYFKFHKWVMLRKKFRADELKKKEEVETLKKTDW